MDKINRQLVDAVFVDDIERATHLLEEGASVNARGWNCWTVLMRACWNKNKAMANLLLKRGAAVNLTTRTGWTALMMVAHNGDEEILDMLLQHNVNVMKKDCDGWTAVRYAAWNNRRTILARLLLPRPCCRGWRSIVDIDDSDGQTPLWWAAYGGHMDCVNVLLIHGANPDHKSKFHGSPIDIARLKGRATILSMMTEVLKLRSNWYVIGMINVNSRLKENICKQQRQIHELKEKEQLQEELTKDIQLKELSVALSSIRRVVEGIKQQPDDSISDPERVFKAVVSRGCDHWYSLCLQMGYSRGQVADITNGIPSNADKIRAAFDIKIDAVGESNATAALLEACRRIPNPIIGGVMDILSK